MAFRWTKEAKQYKALLDRRGDRSPDDIWKEIEEIYLRAYREQDLRASKYTMAMIGHQRCFSQVCFFLGLKTRIHA